MTLNFRNGDRNANLTQNVTVLTLSRSALSLPLKIPNLPQSLANDGAFLHYYKANLVDGKRRNGEYPKANLR